MSRWIEVATDGPLPPGEGRTVRAGGKRLALFNDGGEYYAIDDACPHEGGSLGEGLLHEGRVICPLHSWVFEIRTGQCPRGTHGGVSAYRTRSTGSVVEVEISEEGSA